MRFLRAGADITASLTLACVGQHAVQIKRSALHWLLGVLRMFWLPHYVPDKLSDFLAKVFSAQ